LGGGVKGRCGARNVRKEGKGLDALSSTVFASDRGSLWKPLSSEFRRRLLPPLPIISGVDSGGGTGTLSRSGFNVAALESVGPSSSPASSRDVSTSSSIGLHSAPTLPPRPSRAAVVSESLAGTRAVLTLLLLRSSDGQRATDPPRSGREAPRDSSTEAVGACGELFGSTPLLRSLSNVLHSSSPPTTPSTNSSDGNGADDDNDKSRGDGGGDDAISSSNSVRGDESTSNFSEGGGVFSSPPPSSRACRFWCRCCRRLCKHASR